MAANMNAATQWNPLQLQAIWRELEDQVHPFSHVLSIRGETFRQLDAAAKLFIARKFMEHVQESVLYVIDGNGVDRVYLGAPKHLVDGGGTILRPPGNNLYWIRPAVHKVTTATLIAPPAPPKHVKIPRPPNAYILYRKERHHHVKNSNPGITNNEISQLLGKAWNLESREVRQKYKDMSEKVKQALLEKHPDYQYRPRRPSERRRRRRNAQSQDQQDNTATNNATTSPGDASAAAATPSDSTDTV
ncbi:MAT1-2-1 [Tolypocladium paradoxum]|uniref:MAT1-2-1 n=2 Tax=Tolypocladium TaxID=29909 RepID=A0A2S4KRT0_9HYPO|nr:MAT1-2-1 [Tolypocladium paradoxum]